MLHCLFSTTHAQFPLLGQVPPNTSLEGKRRSPEGHTSARRGGEVLRGSPGNSSAPRVTNYSLEYAGVRNYFKSEVLQHGTIDCS